MTFFAHWFSTWHLPLPIGHCFFFFMWRVTMLPHQNVQNEQQDPSTGAIKLTTIQPHSHGPLLLSPWNKVDYCPQFVPKIALISTIQLKHSILDNFGYHLCEWCGRVQYFKMAKIDPVWPFLPHSLIRKAALILKNGDAVFTQFFQDFTSWFSRHQLLLAYHEIVWTSMLSYRDFLNPFTPGNFAEKDILKLVKPFSGHCLAIKS